MYWDEAESMEELVDFLVRYVRLVHCNSYFKSKLAINEGKSYIDMLTANDIAYAVCLLANGLESWRSKKANNGVADKDAKMRFSAGEHMKRERSTSTWNKEGREYFKSAETAWKRAFKPGTDDYKVLRQYWNKWIEKEGKTFMLGGLKEGVKRKSAHQVLRTIPVGHAKRMAMAKKKAVEVDDDEEEFVYESEDDDNDGIVDVGNWGERQGRLKSTGEEDDEEDDDNDGADEYDGNAEVGDKEDEEAESSGDDDEDERSLNGIQELMEDEAEAAGMRSRKRKVVEKHSTQPIDEGRPRRPNRGQNAKFGTVVTDTAAASEKPKTTRGKTVNPKKN